MNITGTTLTGCILGPYYDPSTIYAQNAFLVPIVDGNLTIATINAPNANTVPLVDGNISINTVNAPAAFGPVFIGG